MYSGGEVVIMGESASGAKKEVSALVEAEAKTEVE